MPHPMMTACGLSLLHRHKFKKIVKMKGGSAHRKGAGLMKPAVMPMPSHIPRRTLQFR